MKKVSNAQIKAALSESFGIKSRAAEALDITRQALGQRIARNKDLQEHLRQVEETCLDLCEQKLLELIEANDFRAVKFFLATKGKARGYVPRQEIGGGAQEPMKIEIQWADYDGESRLPSY